MLEHVAETIMTCNGTEERQSHPGKYPRPDEGPGRGVEYTVRGWENCTRLYRRHKARVTPMYKQTLTITAESLPEVGMISPKRNMKMERCKDVFSDSIMR